MFYMYVFYMFPFSKTSQLFFPSTYFTAFCWRKAGKKRGKNGAIYSPYILGLYVTAAYAFA